MSITPPLNLLVRNSSHCRNIHCALCWIIIEYASDRHPSPRGVAAANAGARQEAAECRPVVVVVRPQGRLGNLEAAYEGR